MKKLKGGNPGQVSLIAENCQITGDLNFKSQLIINGVVEGNVCALDDQDAIITVGQRGLVKGEIRAPTIVVNGKVEGDIYSEKHLELSSKANVRGAVYYRIIEMVKGSQLLGSLRQIEQSKAAQKSQEAAVSREESKEKTDSWIKAVQKSDAAT
ncbi:MAG: polymer-forming cytoskeletal protein [Gammaproteobacteria bacterium]|jgi:cytoskeletal protein CcmA (bactofilin family)|nr:polymer-forming cytoskeletal protein [Gammaproteobacteria bacterium]MBT5204078.1 polymer-forming cytoskeletal protein [Gammaproteobacteria bacterium]MBT5602864.1 polymer-forming cytoskeletal protein [Gammaproteobacteria bacterium]MBT6246272.1 polymer-forming cytoskeletal protein [Gammaproteobacteria bacterium]